MIFLIPNSPLLMMNFQKEVEEKAFAAGGGKFVAPAQRMVDFATEKMSNIITAMLLYSGSAFCIFKRSVTSFYSSAIKNGF